MDKLIHWETLRDYCRDLFVAQGMDDQDAYIVADSLVHADLSGVESHGVSRMSIYMKRIDEGVVEKQCRINVLQDHPASFSLDARNSMGIVVGVRCMDMTISKARTNGAAFTAVNHSNHFGTAAYFTTRAAKQNMIGFAASNAPPNMAPWGSSQKFLGTNPFSIAIPTNDDPIVLDMATSVVAQGKIILAAKTNKSIPTGWAITKDGNDTTDPNEALQGTVLPMGGPKGYAIGLVIEILCGILTGAAFGPHLGNMWNDFTNQQNVGHVFMALDIQKYINIDTFLSQTDLLKQEIKALPKVQGVQEIYMPGEMELQKTKERKQNGIPVSASVYNELSELGKKYQVAFNIH